MVGRWWVVVVGCSSWQLHGGGVGWLVVVNEDVAPGGCQKGGWEGPCVCLPGLGTTLSPSLPAVDQVCVLGAGDVVL